MTFEKALNEWKVRRDALMKTCPGCWGEDAKLAIEALEKQVPKKVVINEEGIFCPECGIELIEGSLYCDFCGQRLEWKRRK